MVGGCNQMSLSKADIEEITAEAKKGNTDACIMLGNAYYSASGVTKNNNLAFFWWQKASNNGSVAGLESVGICYCSGIGVRRDLGKGISILRRAADRGSVTANKKLGEIYISFLDGIIGSGVSRTHYPESEISLITSINDFDEDKDGILQLRFQAFERIRDDAIQFLMFGVSEGDSESQYLIGLAYETGYTYPAEAFKWYEEAAKNGNSNGQYRLGNCYEKGRGVNIDYNKAFFWYEKAANQGIIEAELALGGCYEKGLGVEKDDEQALYWYKEAEMHGSSKASFFILRNKAKKGDSTAQYKLAAQYEKQHNLEEAYNWYEKSAKNGNPDATSALKNHFSKEFKDARRKKVDYDTLLRSKEKRLLRTGVAIILLSIVLVFCLMYFSFKGIIPLKYVPVISFFFGSFLFLFKNSKYFDKYRHSKPIFSDHILTSLNIKQFVTIILILNLVLSVIQIIVINGSFSSYLLKKSIPRILKMVFLDPPLYVLGGWFFLGRGDRYLTLVGAANVFLFITLLADMDIMSRRRFIYYLIILFNIILSIVYVLPN